MIRSPFAKRLEDIAAGYVPAMALFAAIELGIFDALDETPCSFSDLAGRIGGTVDGTSRLCRALAVLGLVEVHHGSVRLGAEAREQLRSDAGGPLLAMMHVHRHQLLPPLLRLTEAVRTGRSQHTAWPFASIPAAATPYDELARHREEMRALALAMDHASTGVGTAIARTVDLSEARLLVDLGGGAGVVARELLTAFPRLHVRGFDHEHACDLARERSIAMGLGDRHRLEAGDVRDGVPVHHADAVLLSAVLADFPPTERLNLLRRARSALRPGGMILISETLLDEDRASPAGAVMLSLVMLTAARGDQLSGAQLAAELVAAGFVRPRIHRDVPRDLVIAIHES